VYLLDLILYILVDLWLQLMYYLIVLPPTTFLFENNKYFISEYNYKYIENIYFSLNLVPDLTNLIIGYLSPLDFNKINFINTKYIFYGLNSGSIHVHRKYFCNIFMLKKNEFKYEYCVAKGVNRYIDLDTVLDGRTLCSFLKQNLKKEIKKFSNSINGKYSLYTVPNYKKALKYFSKFDNNYVIIFENFKYCDSIYIYILNKDKLKKLIKEIKL